MPALKYFASGVLIAFLSQNIAALPTPEYNDGQDKVRAVEDGTTDATALSFKRDVATWGTDADESPYVSKPEAIAARDENEIELPVYDVSDLSPRDEPEIVLPIYDSSEILVERENDDSPDWSGNGTIIEEPNEEEETSDVEKRDVETTGACAMRLQPKWPKVQLTPQQSAQCVPHANHKAKRQAGLQSASSDALKSSDGKYELSINNCGPRTILKKFIDADDFKLISERVCKKMVEYPADDKILAPVDNKWGLIGSALGIAGRKKIAATVNPGYGLNVGLGLYNYLLKATPENKQLAMDICQLTVGKITSDCVVGLGSTQLRGISQHQVQRAASATWIDAKTRAPALLFDFSFWD